MTTPLGVIRRDWRSTPSSGLLIAVAALMAAVPGLAVPLLIRAFLNQVLVVGDTAWVTPVLWGLLGCALTAAALVWIQWRTARMVAVRMSATTAAALVWHMLRLPSATIDRYGPGELTGRASGLQIRAFQAGVLLPLAFVNALIIVVYSVVLVALSVQLGIAALIVVFASSIASYLLLRRRQVLQDAALRAGLDLTAQTTQVVSGIETIKANAAEQWVFDRWSQTRSAAGQATSDLEVDGQRLGLISPFTQVAGLGIVLALGTLLVFQGELTIGTLVAVQGILAALLIPAGQIVWFGVLLESVTAAQRYADEIGELPLDADVVNRGVADGAVAGVPQPDPSKAVTLVVRDVEFGYEDLPLFSGLDLTVPAGAWVAVVGGSGSGKSTLARLCVGEIQPWSGSVLLDGVPRLDRPRSWRAAAVGYVPQHPVLVPGSILDNIRMFDPTVSEEEVERALETACIREAIDRRPAGLLEEVEAGGHGFSGGELQRLAIARALVRDPGLLVLDEATSALDSVVEAELERRLRARAMTCLVIAHRLSTVRDADEIVVLERGRIVQRGTFNSLSREGRFQELVHG